jgi:hypothetical protein
MNYCSFCSGNFLYRVFIKFMFFICSKNLSKIREFLVLIQDSSRRNDQSYGSTGFSFTASPDWAGYS